ncbi:hypothetical protein [Sunxiuqinia dokdonensis]|uniref:DUF3566 domain-containing protein n=1 Tax=Sunxiuqinia dokdonensis TaxID=1409788 RepID=A0A0L8VFA2_9BACT|nr:hypothetical protein [Sunxiuqinia dokdonensis]KOH46867.1 hypothetical protein NC99_02670 [Sunxiuqinia dokdonensis]
MKRIKRFNVWQTAKVVSLMYFLVMAVFMIPFGIIGSIVGGMFGNHFPFGGLMFVFLPFLYGIVFFLFTALGCAIYNLISGWIGGIEVEVEVVEE